jgi:energy-coupling factor transport system substrate-specific component
LYAPAQALFFNLDFNATIAWIIAGLPYDLIHGASNFLCGILIVPIITILKKSAMSNTSHTVVLVTTR